MSDSRFRTGWRLVKAAHFSKIEKLVNNSYEVIHEAGGDILSTTYELSGYTHHVAISYQVPAGKIEGVILKLREITLE